MKKSCLACYFKYSDPEGCTWGEECFGKNICEKFTQRCCKCNVHSAEYKYKGQYYCAKCLLSVFNVEEERTTKYYLENKFLGDDNDIEKVINNLNGNIEKLK